MQESKPKKNIPLKKILDRLEKASKADTLDYTSGHLNPTHLYKPQALVQKTFWDSWKTKNKESIQRSKSSQNLADDDIEKMKDAWSDFTIKTSIVPGSSRAKCSEFSSSDPKMSMFGPNTPINTPFIGSSYKIQESETSTERGSDILRRPFNREELEPSEVKLFKFKPAKDRRTSTQDHRGEYTFVPLYLAGLTKKDQMKMLLKFEKDFVKKQDLIESQDFNKNETIERQEKKMAQELMKINDGCPPHFKRLQIISASFEDLCRNSVIFGSLFSQIKNAYDLYLDFLLDSHPEAQYESLLAQICGMKKRAVMSSDVLQVKQEVKKLEEEAISALERNEQLRHELETALQLDSNVIETETHKNGAVEGPAENHHAPTVTEQFETKRCQVLATWQAVQDLEQDIREHMVHVTDTHAMEKYIQDVKAEATQLDSSNTFLQRVCNNLESDLQSALTKQKIDLENQEEVKCLLRRFLSPDNN